MTPQPYTIRRTTHTRNGRSQPAELLTFTGSTPEEYDEFLDARFGDSYEGLGWRTDARARGGKLTDGRWVWFQWRRLIIDKE